MIVPNGENRLEFFKTLCRRAEAKRDGAFQNLERNRKQYLGSNEIDGSTEPASMVRNITYELIESQVSTQIPAPRVDAKCWSERHGRNAKSIERLCAAVRNELPFERINDQDERNTYIYGGSVWLVEWDNSIRTHNTVGGVRVSLVEPNDFIPQPGIFEVRDMDYLFIRYQCAREELSEKFGISPKKAEAAENDEVHSGDDGDEDTCTVYTCYYRGEDRTVSQFTWSGDVTLADINDYYARKRHVCRKCGRRRELCRSDSVCDCGGSFVMENEEFETLTHDVVTGDGGGKYTIPAMSPSYRADGTLRTQKVKEMGLDAGGVPIAENVGGISLPRMVEREEPKMEPTKIRWYKPTGFPIVVRKNTSKEHSVFGQSDCEYIRYQQQEINKIESHIHEKIMTAGIYPILPDDAEFIYDATIGSNIIRLKPGEDRSQYGVVDTMPNIAQEQSQSDRLYEQAKRMLGITASYQGQADTTAKSGVAKQVQVAQSAGRLDSKRVMKNAAYADIDRIIFEYYLAYADEPRPIAFKDSFGRMQNTQFNRYDFVEWDEDTHEWFYEDRYLFSVDQNGGADEQRETMWNLNLQNLQAGVYGNPAEVSTILRYWQMQEQAHYPYARQNVEYFEALIAVQTAALGQSPAQIAGAGMFGTPAQALPGGGVAGTKPNI